MQFNITFFLQIFNFAITYWFLNKFMFKPVLFFIQKRKKKENKIKQNLEKKELNLINLENNKKEELHNFKFRMKEKYQTKSVKEPNIPSEIKGKIDRKNAPEIIKKATKILVKRIPHVN